MKAVTPEVLEAFSKLADDNRFGVVMDWIKGSAANSRDLLVEATQADRMRQLQGECQVLGVIIDTARVAAEKRR